MIGSLTHLQVEIESVWGPTLLTGGCRINWLWKSCITFGDATLILVISFHCQDVWYSKYIFLEMLALLLLVLVQSSRSQFHEQPRPITATAGDGQPVKLGQWHQGKTSSPSINDQWSLSLLLQGMVNLLHLVSGIKQKIIMIMLIYQSYKYHTSAMRIIFTEYPILSSYQTHRSELLLSCISCVNIQPS